MKLVLLLKVGQQGRDTISMDSNAPAHNMIQPWSRFDVHGPNYSSLLMAKNLQLPVRPLTPSRRS